MVRFADSTATNHSVLQPIESDVFDRLIRDHLDPFMMTMVRCVNALISCIVYPLHTCRSVIDCHTCILTLITYVTYVG